MQRETALEDPDDVFFLEAGELLDALGRTPRPAVRETAARRRRDHERFRDEIPPEVLLGDSSPPAVRASVPPIRQLHGTGVSPGRRSGSARVVLDVRDLESVREGDVIVARATDPSWTSSLSLGAAIVLEMGGLLSHGAIVARELGIPAVVDVARATQLIRSGDRIEVDGTTGEVAVGGSGVSGEES